MRTRTFLGSIADGARAALVVLLVFAAHRYWQPTRAALPPEPRPKLDAPYVQTVEGTVEAMLDLAAVGPGDHVVDLGCGDGRILVAAARRGASGYGVDIDPARIAEARSNALRAGVAGRIRFEVRDLFEAPIGDADVVALYLLPEINLRLRPRLLSELRPGARIVSNSFGLGDWRPDRTATVGGAPVYLWIVPERSG